jgi:hypothetical protein
MDAGFSRAKLRGWADEHRRAARIAGRRPGNPDDWWAVSTLASAYFSMGDFVNARKWYARQIEMGGPDVDVFFAMFRVDFR